MTHTPGPWAFDGIRVYAPAAAKTMTMRLVDGDEIHYRGGLIALVSAPGNDQAVRAANAHLIAAAPTMLETLHAVWRLVETLDIGTAEKSQVRDLVYPAIDEARGPYPRVGTR